MTLSDYLDKNGITADRFARKIRVTASSVYKYRAGTRYPRAGLEAKIWAMTNGSVGPKDWRKKANGRKRNDAKNR